MLPKARSPPDFEQILCGHRFFVRANFQSKIPPRIGCDLQAGSGKNRPELIEGTGVRHAGARWLNFSGVESRLQIRSLLVEEN